MPGRERPDDMPAERMADKHIRRIHGQGGEPGLQVGPPSRKRPRPCRVAGAVAGAVIAVTGRYPRHPFLRVPPERGGASRPGLEHHGRPAAPALDHIQAPSAHVHPALAKTSHAVLLTPRPCSGSRLPPPFLCCPSPPPSAQCPLYPTMSKVWTFQARFMIVASFARIRSNSGHDHGMVRPEAAFGLRHPFVVARRRGVRVLRGRSSRC